MESLAAQEGFPDFREAYFGALDRAMLGLQTLRTGGLVSWGNSDF